MFKTSNGQCSLLRSILWYRPQFIMDILRVLSIVILVVFALGQSIAESNNRVKRQDLIRDTHCPKCHVRRYIEKVKHCIPCKE